MTPKSITLLNPGQCVRVGIYSTGDNRDEYLEKTKLSFRVQFAGHSDVHPFAPPSQFKQIKPEGGDFVTAALNAGGAKLPDTMKTMASLGASGDHWCVPIDAGDGTATVHAETDPLAAVSSKFIDLQMRASKPAARSRSRIRRR